MPPEKSVEEFEWSPGASAESTAPLEGSAEELEQQRGALESLLSLSEDESGEDESGEDESGA